MRDIHVVESEDEDEANREFAHSPWAFIYKCPLTNCSRERGGGVGGRGEKERYVKRRRAES